MKSLFYLLIATLLIWMAACSTTKAPVPEKIYPLHGEVVRLDSKEQVAAIKHDAIGDWMGAMTMEFPIRNKADFEKLTIGAEIRGKVHVQDLDYDVRDVEVIRK